MIEKSTCAVALTEHCVAIAPVWNSRGGALWLQINTFTTSKDILPEYRGRILCILAKAAAERGYFNEAFQYYNRAANDQGLTPWQRVAILHQHINTAKRYKHQNQEYHARKRIFYDSRNGRGARLNQLQLLIPYLVETKGQAEFNELLKYGARSNIKLSSAEANQYRKMFREYRKKKPVKQK
jgi:hypothetical protein